MTWLKKWWGTALPILTAGFYFLLPAFQTWAANHPKSIVASLLAVVVAAHASTAPKDHEIVTSNADAVAVGQKTIPTVE